MTNLEFYKDEIKSLGFYKVYCLVNHYDICQPLKDELVVDWLCADYSKDAESVDGLSDVRNMECTASNFIKVYYRLERLSELLGETVLAMRELSIENICDIRELYTLLTALAERLCLDDVGNREVRELINKIKFEVNSLRKIPSLNDMVNEIVSEIEKLPED